MDNIKEITTTNSKKSSYQKKLTSDEIKTKLKDYKRIDDFKDIPLNTHIRYFILNKNSKGGEFRIGGFLKTMDIEKEYIVLTTDKFSWSVQFKNHVFFAKMNSDDFKKEFKQIIKDLKKENSKLKDENNKLKNVINKIEIKRKKEKNK